MNAITGIIKKERQINTNEYPILNLKHDQVKGYVYNSKLSPLSWAGSKRIIIKELFEHIPEHETFIDLFAGGLEASIGNHFFNKKLKKLIINDGNINLYNLYTRLKDKQNNIFNEYKKIVLEYASKEKFNKIKNSNVIFNNIDQKIATFLFFQNFSLYSSGSTFRNIKNKELYLETVRFRCDLVNQVLNKYNAEIYNKDFFEIIKQINKSQFPNAFIYCDPPYIQTSHWGYYNNNGQWDEQKLKKLIFELKKTGIKFAISESSNQIELFKKEGLKTHIIKTRKSLQNKMTEILATNY